MPDPTIAAQFEEMRQTTIQLQDECAKLREVATCARILHGVETTSVTNSTLVAHSIVRAKAVDALGKALNGAGL